MSQRHIRPPLSAASSRVLQHRVEVPPPLTHHRMKSVERVITSQRLDAVTTPDVLETLLTTTVAAVVEAPRMVGAEVAPRSHVVVVMVVGVAVTKLVVVTTVMASA